MKLQIREGSAAKNFAALVPLIGKHPKRTMLCSDDKHPDDLARGHIDQLARRAVRRGIDPLKVVRAACVNPVLHYKLDVGLLRKGDPADFIVVNNLKNFKVLRTYIDGKLVARRGKSLIERRPADTPNNFKARPIASASELAVAPTGDQMRVIGVRDGQLVTDAVTAKPKVVGGNVVSDPQHDVLKIVVVNRYKAGAKPAVGFVKGFGLKRGAIASSVAHDSHNIIAVGATDADLQRAVNLVIENRGGLAVVDRKRSSVLPLPIAGLMSNDDGYRVGRRYTALDRMARRLGTGLHAPFMTLSFLALPVIPKLKITDRGLFDGERFSFTPTFTPSSTR
jgi:adenine deaminase